MSEHRFGDLARRVLEEAQTFDVVLTTGARWTCQLRECGEQELLVETASGTYLLPSHSILYVVLSEEEADAVLREAAAEVPQLREFLESDEESLRETSSGFGVRAQVVWKSRCPPRSPLLPLHARSARGLVGSSVPDVALL